MSPVATRTAAPGSSPISTDASLTASTRPRASPDSPKSTTKRRSLSMRSMSA